jgi:RimJ/RimL family protein N-acetyltransferase
VINFTPTTDRGLIEAVVKDRDVWPYVIDDSLTNPDLFIAPVGDRQYTWVMVTEDSETLGMFMAQRMNYVTYEVHTMLLKPAYGRSTEVGRLALEWAFNNLDNCRRIVTQVPGFNKLAERLCRRLRLDLIGVNKKSYQYNGVLYDVSLYGISKEDLVCL